MESKQHSVDWRRRSRTRSWMGVLDYGDDSVSVAFEVDAAEWAAKVYRPEIVGKSALLYKKAGYTM